MAKAEEEEERGENKESIPHSYSNNRSKEAQNSRNTGLPCLEKYVLTHSGGGGGTGGPQSAYKCLHCHSVCCLSQCCL